MNQLIFIKLLIGSSVLVGGASSGAYFGTKTTVEQYLKHNKTRNTKAEDFKKIISAKSNSDGPKSKEFLNFKTDKTWEKLKEVCDRNLDSIQKIFWKEQIKIEGDLEEDLKVYCFYSDQ